MKKNKFAVLILTVVLLFAVACGAASSDSVEMQAVPMTDIGAGNLMSGAPQEAVFPEAIPTEDWAWEMADEVIMDAAEANFRVQQERPPAPQVASAPEPDGEPAVTPTVTPTEWATPDIPQPAAQRRVIRNSDIAIETLYFDETVEELARIIAVNGGFIETSSQRLATRRDGQEFWQAEYVIRVPVARFDTANQNITELGQITRFTTNSEDVTMLFLDLQSRLSIREEEERRVEAMRDAATTLQDKLALERQLSDLRVIVDRYRRRMTEIDQLASFSTIRLAIREIHEIIEPEEEEYIPYVPAEPPAPDGFGTRLATAFGTSLDFSASLFTSLAIIFVSLLPPIALLALPAYGIFRFLKKYKLLGVMK
ncbi:MAG: DUF4349 domain-containing protein [Defluviitaleaceae bacterium]|nr:DUF4349 domain-containing protein [Defluviitaleaceae bacterium]MCL2261811.1 DUF4349 domain-containing protein [Defluviitaleaceae bacterium]